MMGVDPRRFGPYADARLSQGQERGGLSQRLHPAYPDEERAAARPLKRTPCYDRMKALGAVFGSVYGWERPDWFAPQGYALCRRADLDVPDMLLSHNHAPATEDGRIVEKWSFRRSNYFAHRRR